MNINANEISNLFDQCTKTIHNSKKLSNQIKKSVELIIKSLNQGNKILVFGNGGSATDAQHLASELIGRYLKERKSIPAIALTTDTAILTAIGNDFGFEKIFSRQCEALVKKNDVVIGISTSGCSKNVLLGLSKAKKLGAKIISLTGKNSTKIKLLSDIILAVPSTETPRIQEGHRIIIHIICQLVEKYYIKK